MASQIRASTMGHRSPSQFIPEIMTSSEQGVSIFASLKSEDGDTDDLQNDAEVHNITSYYSPINDGGQASESRILNVPTPISIHTPIPDQLPRQDFRGKFRLILNCYLSILNIFSLLCVYYFTRVLAIFSLASRKQRIELKNLNWSENECKLHRMYFMEFFKQFVECSTGFGINSNINSNSTDFAENGWNLSCS